MVKPFKTLIMILSSSTQIELSKIVSIINEIAPTIKIFLYGPWIYELKNINYSYASTPYHLLVIFNDQDFMGKEPELISIAENRCKKVQEIVVVAHTMNFINTGLMRGQIFFINVIENGFLIYDSKQEDFTSYSRLTPIQLINKLKVNQFYHRRASTLLKLTKIAYNLKDYEITAFLCHQATELFLKGFLKVSIGFSPTTHNLKRFLNYTQHFSPEILNIFFPNTDATYENKRFNYLMNSYTNSRYNPNFTVDIKLVTELIELVTQLQFFCKESQKKTLRKLQYKKRKLSILEIKITENTSIPNLFLPPH